MPSSVKDTRVTKSSPARRSHLKRTLGARENSKKTLPLVERTNQLSLEQFISSYVPFDSSPDLGLTISTTTTANNRQKTSSQNYRLDIYTAKSIPPEDFETCFRLIELTSSNAYDDSSIGWSPTKKRKEMRLPDMRYLILRNRGSFRDNGGVAKNQPGIIAGEEKDAESASLTARRDEEEVEVLGFLSFMVTYENGKEVIYCYEIHLSPAAQGQGFGTLLMARFESIGRQIGLEKAMLTVFRSNVTARRFYEKLGYDVDEFSPQPRVLRNGTIKEPDYLIMSKSLKEEATKLERADQETWA